MKNTAAYNHEKRNIERSMNRAWQLAESYISGLKVGDTFTGVTPEAIKSFPYSPLLQHVFTTAGILALECVSIYCAPDSTTITKIER